MTPNWRGKAMSEQIYHVIKDYQTQYPDPLIVSAGDTLEISKEEPWDDNPAWIWLWCSNQQGRSGWVPQNYLERSKNQGTMRFDYSTQELTVAVGEILTSTKEAAGWAWCTNQQGKSGWVPLSYLTHTESSPEQPLQ
jgi:hypothetical protein